jgi:hypothetical protein
MNRVRDIRPRKQHRWNRKLGLEYLEKLTALIVALTGLVAGIIQLGNSLHWW